MKKSLLIILISCFLFACKTTKATTANDTTSKATADTALGGDKLKDATKP